MSTVIANDLVLAYDRAGDAGSPVVFLHGIGSDRAVWRAQLEDLGQDHQAIALDFRGHGGSEIPRDPIDRRALAADVAGLLDALGLRAAHLVGLSMGGVVALETYMQYPERVLSLTLADAFARYPGWEEAIAHRERDLRELSMREVAEARIPSCLRPNPDPETLRAAVEQMAAKDKRAYAESSAATWSADFRELLPKITVPTLILRGECDRITPYSLSEELHGGIPGSRLVEIPSAGHISNLDNPAAFNAALREFLEHADAVHREGDVL